MSACLPYPTLVALWAGELNEAEAAAVDEHLFGCDACAAATERIAKVVGTLRDKLPFVISHAHRERLEASDTRIAVTDVDPTLGPSARFTPNVDLLVFALRGGVSSADRVDRRTGDHAPARTLGTGGGRSRH
jgi:anti-sigma factor RsiW